MSHESNSAVRFFDRFLEERNIQWILALGMLIVLASSLLLVGWNWHEAGYTPWWKYLTLVAYWGLVNVAGQWGYHRLGLRKTGTVLMALAVLLAPLSFLALRWLEVGRASWGAGLLCANFAVSAAVVVRVFGHFLRGTQPTFIASYLLLSLAWAVVPGVDWSASSWTPAVAGGLWLTFAAGVVKVNRHVFWLTEEHRLPRAFGFLPIALLGALFLGLFGGWLAPHLSLAAWGLGSVLVAIPVVLTGDAVAEIHDARTGGLLRPLPWSIGLPLGVGLILCVGGLVLACAELRPPHAIPLPLVPTAALAAVVFGRLARRTGRSPLVWLTLLSATLAYNFSYVVCKDVVRTFLAQAASAISEQRLPVAYYGLTYLPFIAILIASVVWRRHREDMLFARPMRTYAMLLAGLLLIASGTHPKALFPVGMALTAVFAVQGIVFRERALLLVAAGAWLAASGGFGAFFSGISGIELAPHAWFTGLVLGTAVLAGAGWLFDPWARRIPTALDELSEEPLQFVGLLASLTGAALWWAIELDGETGGEPAWGLAAVIGGLLVAAALRQRFPRLAIPAYCFGTAVVIVLLGHLGWYTVAGPAPLIGLFLIHWIVARALPRAASASSFFERVNVTFRQVLVSASDGVLTCLLPLWLLVMACLAVYLDPSGVPYRLVYLGLCGWAFDAAYRRQSYVRTVLGALGLATLAAEFHVDLFESAVWLPVSMTALALAGCLAIEMLARWISRQGQAESPRNLGLRAIAGPLEVLLLATLGLVAARSCLDVADVWRVAGLLAAIGGVGLARWHRHPAVRRAAMGILNLQVLSTVVQLFDGSFELDRAAIPLSLAAAGSLVLWQQFADDGSLEGEIARIVRLAWRGLFVLGLLPSFEPRALTGLELLGAAMAFGLVAAAEASTACRRNERPRVWASLGVMLLGAAYLFHASHLPFEGAMFCCWGLSIACCLLGKLAHHRPSAAILAGPLALLAQTLPLVTVWLGLVLHLREAGTEWRGLNSLALLLSAGFYFWQAIERGERRYWLLPGGILNVALVLLWRELDVRDPQFYMIPIGISVLALVEWLRGEIPVRLHDPLRYAGALIILVSPTFHIVEGSWLHLATLMAASVAIVLVSIGLQIRASMYLGTAFLLADLAAMLVRGSIDHPNLLWIAGLALGAAVVALAAVCENHRERVLERIRLLSAVLEHWH